MAIKYSLICMVLAAYFQGIEARGGRVRVRGGRGGGGNDFLAYVLIFGSVIMAVVIVFGFIFCLSTLRRITLYMFRLCCRCANQQAEVDAEQAKLVNYLQAQQYIEQSTADEQSGPLEQMGFSQLNSDNLSPRTLNGANITEETPMTSDVQSGPWEQMGPPQLELDTTSPMTSYDANVTEKTPMTSYV